VRQPSKNTRVTSDGPRKVFPDKMREICFSLLLSTKYLYIPWKSARDLQQEERSGKMKTNRPGTSGLQE
jgi:hypothetical protein